MPAGDFSNPPPMDLAAQQGAGTATKKGDHYKPDKSKLVDQKKDRDTFDNGDGTFTDVISMADMNVKDDSGKWKKIDNKLEPEGKKRHKNKAGAFTASIADSTDTKPLASVTSESDTLSFDLSGIKAGKKSKTEANKATFSDALENTDVTYEVINSQLKETIVVKSRPDSSPTYHFTLDAKGLTGSTDADGTIKFTNKKGKVAFRVPKGIAWDSAPPDKGTDTGPGPVQVT